MDEDIKNYLIRENEKLLSENNMLSAKIDMLLNENFFLKEVVKNFSNNGTKE